MAGQAASLQADLNEYNIQLETVLESLLADPQNPALQELQQDLEAAITATQIELDAIAPVAAPTPKQPAVEPENEKWSKANHPAFQPGYKRPGAAAEVVEEVQAPVELKVNDMVMAKWVSGDKAFYDGRIISITGSKADPLYTVTFTQYNTSDTVRSHDIKPKFMSNGKKRKAESGPATPTIPSMPTNSNVISAAANINPELVRKEPSKVSDGPPKPAKAPKKIKANKEYAAAQNSWKDFTTKGKMGKAVKKNSMFRTGEGVTARVGFTGSGQTMRKDEKKTRHVYDKAAEEY